MKATPNLPQSDESGKLPDLIIFDLDGTLADRESGHLLPGRRAFFLRLGQEYPGGSGPQLALATNQGGVGLRHWMETGNFGEPERYPTQAEAEAKLNEVAETIGSLSGHWPARYISFAYQARSEKWGPTPPETDDDPRWSCDWRKPAPGMLLQAMNDAGVIPEWTLMVGDRDEDAQAAEAAGCAFAWAEDFFGEVTQ